MKNKAFTIIELLITVGIITVISTVVVLLINPTQLVAQARDAQRISDLKRLDTAIQLNKNSLDEILTDNTAASIVYVSLPDKNASLNDNCGTDGEYSLPTLTSGWQYRCVASSANLRKIDGTGWIPIVFTSVSTNPLITLPIDPANNASYYYAYTKSNGSATVVESNKYISEVASTDGGSIPTYFETTPITWLAGLPLDTGWHTSSSTSTPWTDFSPSNIVNDSSTGTVAWTNILQAAVSDDFRASVNVLSGSSYYLKAANLGFNIPATAIVDDVQMGAERYKTGPGPVTFQYHSVKNNIIVGTAGEVFDSGYGNTESYNHGTGFGVGWTATDINSPNFGAAYSVTSGDATVYIDYINERVFYTVPPGGVVDDSGIGTDSWIKPYAAGLDDAWYSFFTSTSGPSHYLKATNFGFNVPAGATIDGIVIEAKGGSGSGTTNISFRPVKNGVPTGTLEIKTFLTGGDVYYTTGGATDLWGTTWTPVDVNSTDFGLALNSPAVSFNTQVRVDEVRIKVYYHQ